MQIGKLKYPVSSTHAAGGCGRPFLVLHDEIHRCGHGAGARVLHDSRRWRARPTIGQLLHHTVYNVAFALNAPFHAHYSSAEDDTPVLLKNRRPHDDIRDPRLVLNVMKMTPLAEPGM
jgi:hypothetical protein